MTKQEFLTTLAKLYAVGNRSDSDSEQREDWTHPDMAGFALCRCLDEAMHAMVALGVITVDEEQRFFSGM